jgi:hypothetical protein
MNIYWMFGIGWIWIMLTVGQIFFPLLEVDSGLRLYYSNAVMMLTSGTAAALCLSNAARMPVGSLLRRCWLLIGAGIGSWGLGQLLFAAYPLWNEGREPPYPYYSDIGFLASPVLILTGLIYMYRSAQLRAPTAGLLAAPVVALLVGYWAYQANVGGMFTAEGGLPRTMASFGYTLLDPVLLAVTVFVTSAFRRGTTLSHAWWLVTAGIVVTVIGNQIWSYLVLTGVYQTGSIVDACWSVGYGLIAIAAATIRRSLE